MPAFGRGKPSIFCWGQHSSPEKQLVEKDVLNMIGTHNIIHLWTCGEFYCPPLEDLLGKFDITD